jgi:hypothetical protein
MAGADNQYDIDAAIESLAESRTVAELVERIAPIIRVLANNMAESARELSREDILKRELARESARAREAWEAMRFGVDDERRPVGPPRFTNRREEWLSVYGDVLGLTGRVAPPARVTAADPSPPLGQADDDAPEE